MTLVKCANLTQGRKIVNALREKKDVRVLCAQEARDRKRPIGLEHFFLKGHCRIKKTKKELDLKFDLTQSAAACIQRMHLSKKKKKAPDSFSLSFLNLKRETP